MGVDGLVLAALAAQHDLKTCRQVAKKVQAAQEESLADAEEAARKAARKAARAAQFEDDFDDDDFKITPKRKAGSNDLRSSADGKKRNVAEGKGVSTKAVSTKVLGASDFRKLHEIVVSEACPAPFETFDVARTSFGVTLAKALNAQGYTAPTPIQAQAWPIALSGQDMVAVAKTGSGKTCGFLLPALARIAARGPAKPPRRTATWGSEPARPSVLVMAPTRELALQIAGEADKFANTVGARVVTVYGGTSKGPQVAECRQGVDILIATPGRLIDLAAGDTKRGFPASVSLDKVTYLVLDEADRMLDMGFEPDIRKIVDQCPKTGAAEEAGGAAGPRANTKRQTLFFTATWPQKVQAAAASLTSKTAVQIRIGQGADGDKLTLNKAVTQEIVMCTRQQKASLLKTYLRKLGPKDSAVVFAGMKGSCDRIEGMIKEEFRGLWCNAIHSGRDQGAREKMLSQFRAKVASENQAVLVATDVAARGLDIPGIALVIVYDFSTPTQHPDIAVENFVHRIGRTGRAGKTGRAVTFWTSEDRGSAALVKLLDEAGQVVPPELRHAGSREIPGKCLGKGTGKGKGKSKGKSKGKGKNKSRWCGDEPRW